MNLAIRKIDTNLGSHNADSFHNDLHKDLKADYILANPPFNDSDWGGDRLREDARWKYGTPPVGNANFAWVQNFIYHLAPSGIAGFVLANGSMSSYQSGEGEIRKALIEAEVPRYPHVFGSLLEIRKMAGFVIEAVKRFSLMRDSLVIWLIERIESYPSKK